MAEILHEITVQAAPDKIFEAITTEHGLKSWWTVDTGWFVDQFTWRLVFFINVPLTVFVLWMVAVQCAGKLWRIRAPCGGLDRRRACRVGLRRPVIWADLGRQIRLCSSVGGGAIVVGMGALVAFVVAQTRVRAPMMPLSLFKSKNFAGANLLTVLLYAPLGGGTLFLPIIMIEVYGYSALAAGAALLPVVFLLATLSRWAGGLINRTGATIPLVVGPIIAALGWGYFALPWFSGNY